MLSHGSRNAVRTYVDLNSEDIAHLTKIFAYDDKDAIKAVCHALPSHLKWRFSLTSPLCTLHQKLNFFPLEHLFDAVKETIRTELRSVWVPMTRDGDLDQKQVDWINALHNNPALVRQKCVVCNFATMALNVELIVAMGAIHMASLNPKNWKKSKRILWFEHCLLARVDLRHQKEIIREMWQTGTVMRQLREAKKSDDVVHRSDTVKRGYIKEFADKARNRLPPPRPSRRPEATLENHDGEPLSITRDTANFFSDVLNHHHKHAPDEQAKEKPNLQVPKPERASSIYSHRPESARPDLNISVAQLFTHDEEHEPVSPATTHDSASARTFDFGADELFKIEDKTQGVPGRETLMVDSIINSYSHDQAPPIPLVAGKLSFSNEASSSRRSLAISTETMKRFQRPRPISMEMNNRGEVEPDQTTPQVWKRRTQREGTMWRYGDKGELIQVTFEEYREAVDKYGSDCGIWYRI